MVVYILMVLCTNFSVSGVPHEAKQFLALLVGLIYFPCAVSHSTTCSMLVHFNALIGNTIHGVSMT